MKRSAKTKADGDKSSAFGNTNNACRNYNRRDESAQRSDGKLTQPAYAKRIHSMRGRGEAPQLAVWVVDGWAPIEDHLNQFGDWVVVIPDGRPVGLVDFHCLSDLQVLIQARNRDRTHEIAEQVWRFYPRQIWGWPEDAGVLTCFVGAQ